MRTNFFFSIFLPGLLLTSAEMQAAGPGIQQVNRALDIAERAAAAELHDLSLRAVVEALKQGPPQAGDLGDRLDGRFRGARVDTTSPLPPSALQAVRNRAIRIAQELYPQWQRHLGTERAIEGIRAVVFPETSKEVFVWWVAGSQTDRWQLADGRGLASLLVDEVTGSDRAAQLYSVARERAERGNVDAASIAVAVADREQLPSALSVLRANVMRGLNRENARFAASCLARLEFHEDLLRREVAAVWHVLALQCRSWNRGEDTFVPGLLLRAARASFAVGRNDRAVELLEALKESGGAGRTVLPQEISRVIGTELMVRGLTAECELLLGRQVVSEFRGRYLHPALAGVRTTEANASQTEIRLPEVQIGDDISEQDAADKVWICSLNHSTGDSTRLFVLADISQVGSLAVSPGGKQLLLHATFPGEPVSSAQMFVISMDDGAIRGLGRGIYPDWSPQGRRIVYSSYSPSRGVWVMRNDGTDRQLLDATGWSAAWAPGGRYIAWIRNQKSGYGVGIYDLAEASLTRPGLQLPAEFPFLSAGMQWSTDGRRLFIRGWRSQGGQAVLDLQVKDPPRAEIRFRQSSGFAERIGVMGRDPVISLNRNGVATLCVVKEAGEAQPLKGQWVGRRNTAPSAFGDAELLYVSRPATNGGN